MPQGYVTRIETDRGYLVPEPAGATAELMFRHWALVPEAGGKWPKPGDYVQFLVRQDPQRGSYLSEVRVLTRPAERVVAAPYAAPVTDPGIKRVDGDERLTMEQVRAQEYDALKRELNTTGPATGPIKAEDGTT